MYVLVDRHLEDRYGLMSSLVNKIHYYTCRITVIIIIVVVVVVIIIETYQDSSETTFCSAVLVGLFLSQETKIEALKRMGFIAWLIVLHSDVLLSLTFQDFNISGVKVI